MKVPSRLVASLMLAALALLIAAPDALAQGCAMCRTAIDGQDDPLARAFNVSTLFLIATPYTLVGTVATWIVVSTRRRRARPQNDEPVHTPW